MFESAELGHKVKKSVYEKEVPALRADLLEAQLELAQSARFAVIILIFSSKSSIRAMRAGGVRIRSEDAGAF